jgi:quinol monooxygenase YgiN
MVLMFIAILDFSTATTDRPAALAQLDREHDEVRAMPGNRAFRVYASRQDDTAITVVHEWDDETSFAGYVQSDSFARSGEVLRPMMTGAPVSRRFHAELLETVA